MKHRNKRQNKYSATKSDPEPNQQNSETMKSRFHGLFNIWNLIGTIFLAAATYPFALGHLFFAFLSTALGISFYLTALHFELKEHYQKKYRFLSVILAIFLWSALATYTVIWGISPKSIELPADDKNQAYDMITQSKNRAIVRVVAMSAPTLSVGERLSIRITYLNSGETLARHVKTSLVFALRADKNPFGHNQTIPLIESGDDFDLQSREDKGRYYSGEVVTSEYLSAIRQKATKLWLYGRVKYLDYFKNSESTDYCAWFAYDAKKWIEDIPFNRIY